MLLRKGALQETDIINRWLAAFIFSAVDYNQMDCHLNAPPGVSCSKKWANEAFIFLTLYVQAPRLSTKCL